MPIVGREQRHEILNRSRPGPKRKFVASSVIADQPSNACTEGICGGLCSQSPGDRNEADWLTNSSSASWARGLASRRRACFSTPCGVESSPRDAAWNNSTSGIVSQSAYEQATRRSPRLELRIGVDSIRKMKSGDCSIASRTSWAPFDKVRIAGGLIKRFVTRLCSAGPSGRRKAFCPNSRTKRVRHAADGLHGIRFVGISPRNAVCASFRPQSYTFQSAEAKDSGPWD